MSYLNFNNLTSIRLYIHNHMFFCFFGVCKFQLTRLVYIHHNPILTQMIESVDPIKKCEKLLVNLCPRTTYSIKPKKSYPCNKNSCEKKIMVLILWSFSSSPSLYFCHSVMPPFLSLYITLPSLSLSITLLQYTASPVRFFASFFLLLCLVLGVWVVRKHGKAEGNIYFLILV